MSESRGEVADLFAAMRVPERFAAPVVAELGESAAKELREDPWRLLALREIRPDQADFFARGILGGATVSNDPRRGAALVTYVLTRAARDGHTVLPVPMVVSALTALDVPEPVSVVSAALDEAKVIVFTDETAGLDEDDDPAQLDASAQTEPPETVALDRYALAEEAVAEGLQRLMATAEPLAATETLTGIVEGLEDDLQVAVRLAVGYGVSVLSGGPGSTRNRVIAALASLAHAEGLRVSFAAANGRAAESLEKLTGQPVLSLHQLLEVREGFEPVTFARGEARPLDTDVVVVDEATTLGIELAATLVEACADGTHLVLVGDPAALPSTAPGRVLADVVESGAVPVAELGSQPESGAIAQLVAAVRRGALPAVQSPEREVVIVPAQSAEEAVHRAVQLVADSIPRALGVAHDEVLVVTPVERGTAGAAALNQALKDRLNPGPGQCEGFDQGDRVVAVADLSQAAAGEVGTVIEIGADGIKVAFARATVTVRTDLLPRLRHGWATTVHRAQGTRWPAIVAVLPGEAAGMLSRPLVYSAFAGALRHLSVVHASGPALASAVRDIGQRPRRTRLVGLLQT